MSLVVNAEHVDNALIEQEFASIKAAVEAASGNTCCCDRDDEFRASARENVIARVLLSQEAHRTVNPTADGEVDAALNKLKEEHGGDVQFYAATGTTPEQDALIRRDLEIHLRVQKLLDGVSPAELIQNGRIDEVMKLVNQLRDAVYM